MDDQAPAASPPRVAPSPRPRTKAVRGGNGRVLYIIDSLGIGGAETLLLDLVDAAQARGWERRVAYFTPGPLGPEFADRGVETTRLSASGLRDPRAVLRACALMRRFRPDVVHTHLTKSDLVGQPAAWAAGVPRRMLTLHNTDPWRNKPALARAYRLATAGAQLRIAVSAQVADHAVATGSAPASGVRTVDNGIDLGVFDPDRVRPMSLEPWGLGAFGTVTIAIIGRLIDQKDHATFLAAAAMVAARRPQARFLVVGDGPLRGALTARSERLGLSDRLVFAGVQRAMPELLAAVDVAAFSSAWEGLPVTLLEAMAMRLPIASTAVGAIPDVVAEGREGLLTPPGDPAALARALDRLVLDPGLRRTMGAAGRRTVAARYGASAMHDRIFGFYGGGADGT
jgi:glycosyltransferase involved in cell wall biosynthesis